MEKTDYANWIPKKLVFILGAASVVTISLFAASCLLKGGFIITVIKAVLFILAVLSTGFFCYMYYARKLFSYEGGGVQGKVLDNVLNHLNWDGNGKLLDVGCGSGAMVIKAAKRFPNAKITGMDYWGALWDYAKEQCENNAKIEGVSDRVHFQKGDAAKLDFADAEFDAVVSNFVFHEVKTQPDKVALIKEVLRVIKPGGVFSFGDLFFSKANYKDLDVLMETLSKEVSEIHFSETRKSDFIPRILATPVLLGETGLIYGRK
ncbi:Methyltransferase family protein [Elusimicrobium minutum Pei191]|uniref:Methyltransferase family protein n=1 Tax=Elusimicrobium minutum (strain Pei191) TaxID=445932 RepID=B2KCR7_ELUMP|nr:class I SAM-dependent methyltransferase [Elusimicrobium minutum]ACC98313.1 Methyltransferase family protein [Elusimicrobium minutum Pei191]